jgi:putrescine transport system permease protein
VKDFLAGLSFDNYKMLIGDDLYLSSYLKSLQVAAFSTLVLLITAYPVAYALARTPRRWQPILLLLVVLPFWVSLLIRVYSWMTILQREGLLNQALVALGLVDEPVTWLASDTAVYIGLVYSYFPFMVLPLYASLERMDDSLLEAAADLGSPPWKSFWTITVPLSLPGIVAGALLCFIPIVGEFVIPDLLGSSSTTMIGQTLWTEFFSNRDWPLASAVAVVLLVLLVAPIVAYQQHEARQVERSR